MNEPDKNLREASAAFERHELRRLVGRVPGPDPDLLAEALGKMAGLEEFEAYRRTARNKRIAAKAESRADRVDHRQEHRRESGRKLHALKAGKGRL